MIHFLRQYGYWVVFLVTLAENLGLPIPAFPLILVAAAMADQLKLTLSGLVLMATSAALLGDAAWYILGRARGRSILRTLCSLSLNPDSCVSRTEDLFGRHGLKSLLVAKFIPGLNTIAPPLAGMLEISPLRFALFDLGGTALWLVAALVLGVGFHSQIEWLMRWLAAFGRAGLVIVVVLLAGWFGLKWVERRRFYRLLESSRISAPELKERLDRGEDIVIVDLRSDLGFRSDGIKVLGALHISPGEFEKHFAEIPRGKPVVMYCT
jgi:membrane protein DedA with SNARE-associated domain